MIALACAPQVYDCILPRPHVGTAEWCRSNLVMTAESKIKGRFRLDLFPHMVEPFAAFDDPEIDIITLQWAAQTAKTTFAQGCVAKTAKCNPHPMVWAEPDENSCRRVLTRTWKLFELSPALEPLCPPKSRQSSEQMRLRTCLIRGAWAGSSTKAADFAAFIVVINEASKIKGRSTDTEADFRLLLRDRATGYVGFKILQMSTPQVKGQCYIEQQRLEGDNRRRMVPCPHCNHFQTLRTGNGKEPGGLRFEKRGGKLDPYRARETAYYQCERCKKRIDEHHRREMCQAGLWVPDGCRVTKAGKIAGEPRRAGRHASFGPLSTLHSLLPGVSFGVCAEEFVSALTATEGRREAIRHYVNSWEGETWDPAPVAVRPSDVVTRLGCADPLRVCPEWSRFITVGVDVGRVGEELLFYWVAVAWGLHARAQLVDYGLAYTRDELGRLYSAMQYPHADRGPQLRPVRWGIDSGNFTETIYDLCRPLPGVDPIKGSSRNEMEPFAHADFPEMYRMGQQRAGLTPEQVRLKERAGAADLIIPNTQRSQEWLVDRLQGLVTRDHPNALTIPMDAFGQVVSGVDLSEQLLGDFQDERGRWKKRHDSQDYRDALRYAMVMAWVHTANGNLWAQLGPREHLAPRPVSMVLSGGEGYRDGRAWGE